MKKNLTILYNNKRISSEEIENLPSGDYKVVSLVPLQRTWNPIQKENIQDEIKNITQNSEKRNSSIEEYPIRISNF